jgi:CRP-like cAMP-binding protein
MEQLLAFLHSIHPLSAALRDQLLQVVRWRSVSRKCFVLKPGHFNRNMCFITRGLLRAFYLEGDTEVSSWFMKEGDICVSIESFYDQRESYESIQALEDTELFYIDYEALEALYQEHAEFNAIGRVLTIKYLKLWAQQLYAIRMKSARERYDWLTSYHPDLLQRVPQKYIASYLDVTPETLSKIRSAK